MSSEEVREGVTGLCERRFHGEIVHRGKCGTAATAGLSEGRDAPEPGLILEARFLPTQRLTLLLVQSWRSKFLFLFLWCWD